MLNLTPFLFDDNCAEAMAFYQSCLGGELTITTVGDTSMKAQVPPEKHHTVAHAHLIERCCRVLGDGLAAPNANT
jgi:PhnB protein